MRRRSIIGCAVLLLALTSNLAIAAEMGPKASCGNGLLEAGETCEKCPADCAVKACTSSAKTVVFDVALTTPDADPASTAVLRVAYRGDLVSLPGKGSDAALRGRIRAIGNNPAAMFNDLDYALRLVLARPKELLSGDFAAIEFDECKDARLPTATDFACVVEACANAEGPISTGCSCAVHAAGGPS
jgi:hypothetical protein